MCIYIHTQINLCSSSPVSNTSFNFSLIHNTHTYMENDMDLDLPLTMEFSDIISFSGLFCDSPTPLQDHEMENSPVSSQRSKEARDAVVVIDDPHLEASSLAVSFS